MLTEQRKKAMETPEKYYLGVPQDMRAELTSCGSRSQRVRGIVQAEEAGAGITLGVKI